MCACGVFVLVICEASKMVGSGAMCGVIATGQMIVGADIRDSSMTTRFALHGRGACLNTILVTHPPVIGWAFGTRQGGV
jgi:hypothetical protein